MSNILERIKKYLTQTPKARLFPTLYVGTVIGGFFLGFLGIFIPFLIQCIPLFGNTVCAPIGIQAAVFVSLPGYIVMGFLQAFLPAIPGSFDVASIITLIAVAILSVVFYRYLGLFFDRKVYAKSLKENTTVVLVTGVFVVLLLVFVYLLRLSSQ